MDELPGTDATAARSLLPPGSYATVPARVFPVVTVKCTLVPPSRQQLVWAARLRLRLARLVAGSRWPVAPGDRDRDA